MSLLNELRPLAAALLATAAIGAQAQTAAPAPTPAPAPAAVPTLSLQQVIERLAARGYRDITEIELEDDGHYEVEARDGQGRKVELKVDGRSGELLAQEVKAGR